MTHRDEQFAFLDVGGNVGQSVGVALSPLFRFSRVLSFEPDPKCARAIEETFKREMQGERLQVYTAALGARNGSAVLSGSNEGGGATTVLADAGHQASGLACQMIDVASVVDDLRKRGYFIFIKLNCEGAEVEILDRLCDAGRPDGIVSVMADFDIVKYPGGYHEKMRVLKRCREAGLPIMLSEDVMVGKSHELRLRNWLAHFPAVQSPANADRPQQQRFSRKLKYWVRDLSSTVGMQKHQHAPFRSPSSRISTKH